MRNAQLAGQPLGSHAVQDAEVDDLGGSAHIGASPSPGRTLKHLRRGARVDVVAAAKASTRSGILRQMGHDAQLDLRVVRGDQEHGLRRGNEGGSESAALRRRGWECSAGSGSLELRRPVAATVWLKTYAGGRCPDSPPRAGRRRRSTSAWPERGTRGSWRATGCSAARRVSTSTSVEKPVLPRRTPFARQPEPVEEHLAQLRRRGDVELAAGES